ncbi:MAG: Hpt domain-containing protein, partial [Myxococcota bacterium]
RLYDLLEVDPQERPISADDDDVGPVLQRDTLHSLRLGDTPEDVAWVESMIHSFLERLDTEHAYLTQHADSLDQAHLTDRAHALKSVAATFGAMELAHRCSVAESPEAHQPISTLSTSLLSAMERVREPLHRELELLAQQRSRTS